MASVVPLIERGVVVVGGGPAGLAAAIAAREAGERSVLLVEREAQLGGILNQCVHSGFGLHAFKEELTGPEYAERYVARADALSIERMLGATVTDLSASRVLTVASADEGVLRVRAGAVVLAMGCRERPRGALAIPGTRPAGVYTAGTAQRLVNVEGQMVGREVVVLGSGDIGLIMARRMTLEGAHVACVVEVMPYAGGLRRNVAQCLDDFGIPLLLGHAVTRIEGARRVEGVVIAELDEARQPIVATQRCVPCDTLLLSVGLLPENELSRAAGVALSPATHGPLVSDRLETTVAGVFACGNVLHVHDLVDHVSDEAADAGRAAAAFARAPHVAERPCLARVVAGAGVRYTVPSYVDVAHPAERITIRLRVNGVYRDRSLCVRVGDACVFRRRRRIMVPGEMQTVVVEGAACAEARRTGELVVSLGEG